MKTHLFSTLIALMILIPFYGNSQEKKQQFQERKKEIDMKKIGFLTERLSLTPQEAQAFWPVYNDYQMKKENCLKEGGKLKKDEKPDLDKLSDKELTEMADAEIAREKKMLDIRVEFHENIKKVLPPKKIVLLYQAEKEFKKVLLNDIRQERREMKAKQNK